MGNTRLQAMRRVFISNAALVTAAALLLSAESRAAPGSAAAEQFVQVHITQIQTLLEDSTLVGVRREAALTSLLRSFIAFGPVGDFVLGRFAGPMRTNHALQAEWALIFRDYAIANYEVRLERFRGRVHNVTGSLVRSPDRDVVVYSEVRGSAGEAPMRLGWRVLRRNGQWQIFDLSVRTEAGEIWLAQQQQAEFLSILDRNDGDLAALAARVREVTAHIRRSPT